MLFHGGFWRHQWTRDLMDAAAVDFARRGWATWNIEYRRIGLGGGWPATLQDAAAAVDHVAELAASRPIDPDDVVVLGHSAGGQLALWTAARNGLDEGDPGASPRVQPRGAVGLAAVTDVAGAARLGLDDAAAVDFLRRDPDQGRERYRITSPIERLPIGVPVVLVHG
ncbi:MAG: alpha/beta hydrolase, partial [Acidimicrobiia bacterium]|nr:alpha/beta hydrolase [Acidimicrobiia bacterium]